jgi:hypothetical protein
MNFHLYPGPACRSHAEFPSQGFSCCLGLDVASVIFELLSLEVHLVNSDWICHAAIRFHITIWSTSAVHVTQQVSGRYEHAANTIVTCMSDPLIRCPSSPCSSGHVPISGHDPLPEPLILVYPYLALQYAITPLLSRINLWWRRLFTPDTSTFLRRLGKVALQLV